MNTQGCGPWDESSILSGGTSIKCCESFSVVDVAQLVRVSDCDSDCRGFESHHPPQVF